MKIGDLLISIPQNFIGGLSSDQRGSIRFVNEFLLTYWKRFYLIKNSSTDIIRAWQGHKLENKAFFPISGRFEIAAVKIDNFNSPSPTLTPDFFILDAKSPTMLIIPSGYANGFQALQENSEIMVFSDLSLEESQNDLYRFPQHCWYS